ncbi:hypothetical protein AOLI_G00026730 [Acnodon oligacanthus]
MPWPPEIQRKVISLAARLAALCEKQVCRVVQAYQSCEVVTEVSNRARLLPLPADHSSGRTALNMRYCNSPSRHRLISTTHCEVDAALYRTALWDITATVWKSKSACLGDSLNNSLGDSLCSPALIRFRGWSSGAL